MYITWRMHTMLWFIQNWPYFEMAAEMGVTSWYGAAALAVNKGLITPEVRKWIPTTTVIYADSEKTEVQQDYARMRGLFDLEVDSELSKLDYTSASVANRGLNWGKYSQFDRMLYEHHTLKNRGRGPQLMRLQLSDRPRTPWYKDVIAVAKRIATNMPLAKLYIDAFTELEVSSSLAYKLCLKAQDNPRLILDYLELAASELHQITLQPDEKEEVGYNGDLVVSLDFLNHINA